MLGFIICAWIFFRIHSKTIVTNFFFCVLGGGGVFLYMQGDSLNVKVNKLTSIKTQLPYSYYSLPYCMPKKIVDSAENLGEVLRGDRIENSPYEVSFDFLLQV